MTHRTIHSTLMGIGWVLVFTALVAAQQPAMPEPMPSPSDMMTACQTHCQESTTAIDPMIMDSAEQSHDPAHMQTALEQAQQPLPEDHMPMCMHMMSMRQQMHGGMGSHRHHIQEKPYGRLTPVLHGGKA